MKSIFIDTTHCTACRGCQVGCKEWHGLPSNHTIQWGSHQNPPDLNPWNFKLIRFNEHEQEDGTVVWNYFQDQCRHCLYPNCKEVADMRVPGAITRDPETGIVLYTEKTRELSPEDVQAVIEACPYNIPRYNWQSRLLVKCDMCYDRVTNGLLPICVHVCPTGAMFFGDREEMLDMAGKRLMEVKRDHPDAYLCDISDVNVIYLLAENKKYYYEYASFSWK